MACKRLTVIAGDGTDAGGTAYAARKWPPTAVEIQRSGASRPKDWSTEKRRACVERVNPFLSVDFVQCIERSEMPWERRGFENLLQF